MKLIESQGKLSRSPLFRSTWAYTLQMVWYPWVLYTCLRIHLWSQKVNLLQYALSFCFWSWLFHIHVCFLNIIEDRLDVVVFHYNILIYCWERMVFSLAPLFYRAFLSLFIMLTPYHVYFLGSGQLNADWFTWFNKSGCWYAPYVLSLFAFFFSLIKPVFNATILITAEGQSETIVEDIENMVRTYVGKVTRY